ncbi:baseplate assembly protein [Thermocrinis sp.]|jgi:phage-related baseplate assembly protein|uniref:baseplate assembly protein n=1 Tax=Thermocrinis sp. TaxID=2024383 RepID=UPI003BFC1476
MDIKFVETDATYWESLLIDAYEKITQRPLYPADPERLLINLQTYANTLLAIAINETAKQNLLAFAKGQYLDALAEFYGVQRLPARKAQTILRFSLAEPLNFDVIIPAGTRVPAGDLYFATLQEAKIPAGSLYVDVPAECNEAGTIGNGFSPGQIKDLMDPLPYIAFVSNITMSMYGANEEDDERFRERIRLSIERFTNAGSRQAYIYHTLSAHQDIEDVEVYSPAPGQVKVIFTVKGGNIPDESMLSFVRDYLSSERIRPLTDQVLVSAPEVVYYDIDLTFYVNKKDASKLSFIQSAVEKAVNDFIAWTKSKIGRDILPEELIRLVKQAGAYRVDLALPTKHELTIEQIAHARNVSIRYGGLVDD